MFTRYADAPIIPTSFCRIEYTPDSVNVRAKILSGEVSVFSKILAIRRVKIEVFPVPGPAITITDPSIASTAFFCSKLRLL